MVSLSDFSTVYFYRGSFLVQSVGKHCWQGGGKKGSRRDQASWGGHRTFPTYWGGAPSSRGAAPSEKKWHLLAQMAQILILVCEGSMGRQKKEGKVKWC